MSISTTQSNLYIYDGDGDVIKTGYRLGIGK